MKQKIKKLFREKRGLTSVQTTVIFLVLMIVFSVIMEYANIFQIAREVESASQLALDGTLMQDAMTLFESVKNGRSSVQDWQTLPPELSEGENSSYNQFRTRLLKQLGLANVSARNGKYYREQGNVFIVFDDGIEVETMTNDLLVIKTQVTIGRDIMFMGKPMRGKSDSVSVRMHIPVTARYTKMSALSAGQVMPSDETTTFGDLLNMADDAPGVEARHVQDHNKPVQQETVTAPSAVGEIEIS